MQLLTQRQTLRLHHWDNVKFILIVLVVLGHFANPYSAKSDLMNGIFLWIYTFHMPLFIFVMGLFSKSAINQKPFRVDRVVFLLMMGVLIKVLVFLAGIPWGKQSFSLFDDVGASWFMFVCAAFYVVTYLVRKLRFGPILGFALLLGIFAGYDADIGVFLNLSRILVFFPFFLAGYHLDPAKISRVLNRSWIKIAAAVVILVFTALIFAFPDEVSAYRTILTASVGYKDAYGALYRIIHYMVATLASLSVIALVPRRQIPYISSVGRRTLQIYVLHLPIMAILNHLSYGLVLREAMGSWSLYLASSLVLVAALSLPWLEWPFARLRHLRKDGFLQGRSS